MERTWTFRTGDYTVKVYAGDHEPIILVIEYNAPNNFARTEIHITAKQAGEIGEILEAASKALGEKE